MPQEFWSNFEIEKAKAIVILNKVLNKYSGISFIVKKGMAACQASFN